MMTAPPERPERLAEILREILALSETKPQNRSKCVADDDLTGSFDAQCVNGIHETGESRGEEAGEQVSEPED